MIRPAEKREAFEDLVRPLMASLYKTACWLVKDPDKGQDLLQETMVKAYRGFDRFELGTNFRAWVFRILRNAFIDLYHTQRREPDFVILDDLDEAIHPSRLDLRLAGVETPEKIILRKLMVADLHGALLSLPEKYRIPVVLCDLEDFSYKEIGGVLGIPIGTVMSRIARGRRMVQKRVLEQGETVEPRGEVTADGL